MERLPRDEHRRSPEELTPKEISEIQANSAHYARICIEHWLPIFGADIKKAARAKERRSEREEGFSPSTFGIEEFDEMDEDIGSESEELLDEYREYKRQLDEQGHLDDREAELDLAKKGFLLQREGR